MKRSVNFSGTRKYALMAAMRGTPTTETWLAEPSAETIRRRDADCELLRAHHLFSMSAALSTACDSVTRSEPRRNLGDFLYQGYDEGWRTGNGGFISPDGTQRKSPTMMWRDAMYAIEYAAELREKAEAQG